MPIIRDIPYTATAGIQQLLDLYLPEGLGPFPVVVWIHGGGWKIYNRLKIDDPQFLVNAGFAVASIDYRLSTVAPFPGMIEDCQSAVRWLRTNQQQYGLNGDQIGAMGASAGGHLAALLGLTAHKSWSGAVEPVSAAVQAVVPICPVTDVPDIWRYWVNERPDVAEWTGMIRDFCGGEPADHLELMRIASPLSHCQAPAPAFHLFHGDLDRSVPISHSHRLIEALRSHAVTATLTVSVGTDHVGIDGFTNRDEIRALVTAFFLSHLCMAANGRQSARSPGG